MIDFNEPPYVESSITYIKDAIEGKHICGDGKYTKKCSEWVEKNTQVGKCLLTTSCTHALEMAAILLDIRNGDEVIMPSYTFASTADAFAMRGATPVFVDIKPSTMNIDEELIEQAITKKTKAIAVVHYAGVACEMDAIMEIAKRHNLYVVEDAAQAMLSTYKEKPLGTIGDFGCYSFHETKNYSMGEGGALLFDDKDWLEKAEILREKGTNRSKFWRGEIDKYSWVDLGSSYLPSEINAAYLWSQLECAQKIYDFRMKVWEYYYSELRQLEEEGKIELPHVPDNCTHNAHMFYIKCKDEEERSKLIGYLKEHEIKAVFHYIPLHIAPAGKKYGRFSGEDRFTTKESLRLLRLPMHLNLGTADLERVVDCIKNFYNK